MTELQLHSKLHHPNIVDFYRAFTYQTSTYVVLDICDNGSLADALKKRKSFTMPEIRRFVIQTCGAVKYLHSRNIVHRDLKTGNLFLDKDMNIKVGDFGLAAVLVPKDDLGARRTTMCGTPNYLAPEILEKGGKGHNEKVDLWAIGIIAYTLAVGKAPFHAAKREDIYKKLQARDYKWPELSKANSDISNDLRELVSSLLVHEDDRPCPDRIVSHPFFKTAFVPVQLSSACIAQAPDWKDMRPPSPETIQRGYSEGWYILCKDSGVGEYAPGKIFPMVGSKKVRSIVRDCQKEIAAGLQPVVPIPSDRVYVPFPARPNGLFSGAGNLSEITEEKESSAEGRCLTDTTANERTQRGQKAPVRLASRLRQGSAAKENTAPTGSTEAIVVPVQTNEHLDAGTKEPQSLARTLSKRAAKPMSTLRAATDKIQRAGSVRSCSASKSKVVERPMKSVERKDSGVATASTRSRTERTASRTGHRQEDPILVVDSPATTRADNSKKEELKGSVGDDPAVPRTDPVAVLDRVSKFRDNVALALSSKHKQPRRTTKELQLPFVTKWVDYSKKHGVGYVLEDGKIGCIYNATSRHPVTHVICQNGFWYLEKAADVDFIEKIPLEYYADCGVDGLRLVTPGRERRRTMGILWLKFARYMCQQLGQAEETDAPSRSDRDATFVRFYQRLGSAGIWGFSDGCFQVSAIGVPVNFQLTCCSSTSQITPSWSCLLMAPSAALRAFPSKPLRGCRSTVIFHSNTSASARYSRTL